VVHFSTGLDSPGVVIERGGRWHAAIFTPGKGESELAGRTAIRTPWR
jgi:hypothetical protein